MGATEMKPGTTLSLPRLKVMKYLKKHDIAAPGTIARHLWGASNARKQSGRNQRAGSMLQGMKRDGLLLHSVHGLYCLSVEGEIALTKAILINNVRTMPRSMSAR